MTTTTAGPPTPARRATGADLALGLAGLGVLSLALIPVEIHRAFGLPAHPLLLHVPVVLVPLLGLVLLACAVRPGLFDRNALAIGAFTVVTLAATVLTVGAGDAFRSDRAGRGPPNADDAHRLSEHAQSGETLRLVMIVVAAIVLFAVLLSRSEPGSRLARLTPLASHGTLRGALRVLFAVAAIVATFFVIRTGHLGAQLTWHGGERGGPPPGGALRGRFSPR